jgi:hypothetical protein
MWLLALLRLPPLQRQPLLCLVSVPAAAAASSTAAPGSCCWPICLAAAAALVSVCEQVPELLAIPQLLL